MMNKIIQQIKRQKLKDNHMMDWKKIMLTSLGLAMLIPLYAEVTLPAIFGSNMVLQRNREVAIWGKADAKSTVIMTASWNNQSYKTVSDKEGNWKIKVATPDAGGPYSLKISDGQELVLENVLIGEVWVCSGQSNMEWKIKSLGSKLRKGLNDILLKSKNPSVRLFTVKHEKSLSPKNDFNGKWEETNAVSVSNFSATGYYFGKLLHETLDVPIGLISSNWGGTRIQAWIDEEGLKSFDPSILEDKRDKKDTFPSNTSTCLFNAMINPMLGFEIQGVLWYQGESNRREPEIYDDLMVLMLERWRTLWGIGEFPFYYCQLAPYDYHDEIEPDLNSAYIREAQYLASKRIPNSGMVSLLDTGEENDIHPLNKVQAGTRLAYFALKETYGVEGIVCRGPELEEMTIDGSVVKLTFINDHGGLTDYGKGYKLFEIAGADKKFYPATTTYISKQKALIISSSEVKNPVAVRYGFKDFVIGDLFNRYGIPAPSFRTDDW
ncbi:sialate O-acetylesterase [Flagellimonas sp.]|uniref:sialate O-acetylesterase n=1 Tax=Flagellimonas sp. TaxID=2058762 RepID=UPI003BAE3411